MSNAREQIPPEEANLDSDWLEVGEILQYPQGYDPRQQRKLVSGAIDAESSSV